MEGTTRRDFIKLTGVGLASTSMVPGILDSTESNRIGGNGSEERLNLGMASYTLRNFSLEDTLAMTIRLGLKRISLKSFHLPLESSTEEIINLSSGVRAAGLELYGCGVVYMRNEEEVHHAFDYAKAGGIKIIIGVPNHELLGIVNRKVQEFDIKVAIHNHGPTDQLYPTPESAYEKIKHLDQRIGLCIDAGHTQRAGVDPAVSAQRFADRLHDVHIKDVSASSREGSTVEIGRGVIDIPKFLQTLLKLDYRGTVAFEHEKDADDPLPGVAESVGYVRGILSVI